MIVLKTNVGEIQVELFEEQAPISSENFIEYVKSDFYAGTIFHRVIDGFMIQGGGFTADMKQKSTRPPIANEAGNQLKNEKYTLAMARTSDPDSATCQFFINTNNNAFLDRDQAQDGVGYAVFGKVVSGTDVVDRIGQAATGVSAGMQDVPTEAIIIESAEIVD